MTYFTHQSLTHTLASSLFLISIQSVNTRFLTRTQAWLYNLFFKMRYSKFISRGVLIIFCLLLSACASKKEHPSSDEPVVAALFKQLNEWKGTPYRYGGSSKSGIDCSAFVQTTYQSLFRAKLPRSTKEQAQLGLKIKPNEHRSGDLIFFRTDGAKQVNHVGIYAENNTFIHASTSKGVTRSSLNNPYWQKNYAYSRRVVKLPSFTQ